MRKCIIVLLLIQGVWAKPTKLPSRIVSYKLCMQCLSCTGIFLDEKTILTAAHCAEKRPWDRYEIRISRYAFKYWDESFAVRSRAFALHLNPLYDPKTHNNDIMIIKLKKNIVKFPADILPPRLVTDDDLNGTFWTTGFGGKTRKMREMPLKLYRVLAKSSILAFDHIGEYRTCFGDSGGATHIQYPGTEPRLAGIISRIGKKKGSEVTDICSPEHYSIHTWLYPHLQWIDSLVEES